jgi:hypothetical protein
METESHESDNDEAVLHVIEQIIEAEFPPHIEEAALAAWAKNEHLWGDRLNVALNSRHVSEQWKELLRKADRCINSMRRFIEIWRTRRGHEQSRSHAMQQVEHNWGEADGLISAGELLQGGDEVCLALESLKERLEVAKRLAHMYP